MPFFESCKIKLEELPCPLPLETLEFLGKGAILVDLREELETEIRTFGVDRVIYLPHEKFEAEWPSLPLDCPLILADAVGLWSKKYARFLIEKGVADIASLAGGIADWEKDGFPVNTGRYQPLNGPCPCMIRPMERGGAGASGITAHYHAEQ